MYNDINEINNKYGTNFNYIKGFLKGFKYIQYLLDGFILKVDKKTKKETFIKLIN